MHAVGWIIKNNIKIWIKEKAIDNLYSRTNVLNNKCVHKNILNTFTSFLKSMSVKKKSININN